MPSGIVTETVINAPLDAVWPVFVDFAEYQVWQTFFQFQAPYPAALQEGDTFTVLISPDGKPSKFTPKLLKLRPKDELRWRGRLFNSNLFFVGEHYFTFTSEGPNATKFVHGEEFKGCLVPLLGGLLQSAKKGFIKFNADLKTRVEGASK